MKNKRVFHRNLHINKPPDLFGTKQKNNTIHLGWCYFYGVDNGTRTHDLQSHNLTP